jgi:uncharacterized membrane protein YcfT
MTHRVDWVDVAKGFCICFVVMMHSTLGVEKAAGATGWMGHLVEFARPFRMPDFFLIAGLFLASRINAPWRLFLDRKVVHFAYFYVLWMTIQFAVKASPMAAEAGGYEALLRLYLWSFIEPFGTLWFIYHLALFMVVVRLVKRVPWQAVWIVGAALEIAPIHTGSTLIDEFAGRFIYFYSGYLFAPIVFRFAGRVGAAPLAAGAGLLAWAVLNGAAVWAGLADQPFVSLALGFAGAGAVIAVSVLLARTAAAVPLSWLGANSIVIYLAFFFPMGLARTVLLKTGVIADVGTISLLVTMAGITGPVVFYALVQWSGRGRWLFERPAWAHIDRPLRRRDVMLPAE